jgi:hypothetical protein
VSLIVPQFLFCVAQLDGAQQVPLWQVSFVAHVPHMSVPPHPSLTDPHACAAQVEGEQHAPSWHVSFVAQVPHAIVPPHPSLTEPHAFAGHALGVQAVQRLFVHICPVPQAPQLTVPVPHPFPIVPQLCAWQTVGIPQTPGTPPPPHVAGAVQAAHVT